jgi:hypothetical protein
MLRDRCKLLQSRFQFFSDSQRQHVRIRKVRAVFERLVPKPENVEINLVPFRQFVIGEAFEPLAVFAFVAVLGVEALNELIQIRTFQRSLLK